jgi:elongation factor P hydroxylase
MKLYTEEQVIKMINKCQATGLHSDYLLEGHTPIELPSDEEIQKESLKSDFEYTFRNGALWMRNLIQGGNNEQQ